MNLYKVQEDIIAQYILRSGMVVLPTALAVYDT